MTAPVRQTPPDASLLATPDPARLRASLGRRQIVLVGLMGAGKSTVGRRLAERLSLKFVDADAEIERSADMTIPEIFKAYGEDYFRSGERRVIARLLQEGPGVLATGGGAFMNAQTRETVAANGISIWLKAELDVLMRRVRKRSNRPLLHADDPDAVMRRLMDERHPVYALADLTVQSHEAPYDVVVDEIERQLWAHLLLSDGSDA